MIIQPVICVALIVKRQQDTIHNILVCHNMALVNRVTKQESNRRTIVEVVDSGKMINGSIGLMMLTHRTVRFAFNTQYKTQDRGYERRITVTNLIGEIFSHEKIKYY